MNPRELATVLAALRYWQREGRASGGHEHDIATNQGDCEALSDAEIDALCERLNAGEVDDPTECLRDVMDFWKSSGDAIMPPKLLDRANRLVGDDC